MTRGRPKSFDDNEALERAMNAFWRYGYDATSLDDLVREMQIPRQSLYRTFGDKRSLFLSALELYGNRMSEVIIAILQADGKAIDNVNEVFRRWSERLTSPERNGCMMQNTCSQSIMVDEQVTALVMTHQNRVTVAMEKALVRGQEEGNISAVIDTKAVARTISSSINGLLALSRIGLPDEFSKDVIRTLTSLIKVNKLA